MESWYRHGLRVLTTPMVLTQTHGKVSVLLIHTCTRGPSVARMRDFVLTNLAIAGQFRTEHVLMGVNSMLTFQIPSSNGL